MAQRSFDDDSSASDGVIQIDPSSIPKTLRKNDSIQLLRQQGTLSTLESRVLVLYTGGTIGMLRDERGALVPVPNQLAQKLRTFPQLHDVEYAQNKFQNVSSNMIPLMLPDTREKRRIVYTVYEYDPLLDSSNMTMDDWIRISQDIRESYELFEGFVILHGTDTLAYTAAALSFMLENLGKSVVITGSQIPIFETRSDGRDNFVGALIMAGNYIIPEVTVLFNNKLFRGNRTQKISTGQLDAFGSPNLPPLATIGISISVDYNAVFRPSQIAKFQVHSKLSRNVNLLRLFPSITNQTVEVFLQPPMEGVVLQSYGAGNIPSNRKDIMDAIKSATARGVIIVNITQCANGGVEALYATGQALVDAGVIAGMDMTPEAALTKLSYVISKTEWDIATKRKMMQKNIRGELTGHRHLEMGDMALLKAVAKTLTISSSEEMEHLKDAMFPCLLCGAANSGDLMRIKSLRKYGADLSAADYDSRTALHIAASKGNMDMVKYLLEAGASCHPRDAWNNTPLVCAIENGQKDCVNLLVDCGAHLSLSTRQQGESLRNCILSGNIERLKCYLAAGCDLNAQDSSSYTPIHTAVEQGHIPIVEFLLSNNVDLSVKDIYGRTALDLSKLLSNQKITEILRRHLEPFNISETVDK